MILTPERKAQIDAKSQESLLQGVRFAPVGDPWFQGETGAYWMSRLAELRDANPGGHVAASKSLGWQR